MVAPEYKAGLPEEFSGKNSDTSRWLLVMKSYFAINNHIYTDKKVVAVILLNRMTKGRGALFTEGWLNKLANEEIPDNEKLFQKICETFEESFIPKDIKDRARQTVYSLSMDMFNEDFNEYTMAF